jgi:transposase
MTARKKKAPSRTRRVFSAEFKLEAVQRAEERRAGGVPLTQVARELGITDELLRRWKRQAGTRAGGRPTEVFPGHGRLPSDEAELRRLEREVRRLSQENAFLKTAAAYFAKESR